MGFQKRIIILLTAIALVFSAGVIGYEWIEGWNFLDALYMTVITLGTIGYGETHPLSPAGRIFTMCLILSGISTVSYGALALTAMVADGELMRHLKRKRMDRTIAKLHQHFIVCGAGKTGVYLIAELLHAGRQVVVVDHNAEALTVFHSKEAMRVHFDRDFPHGEVFYLEGDATLDKCLLEAGIEHAEGIFCALQNDKDNLFVALTARGLNSRIKVVCKCQDEESVPKFTRVGADRIVSPNRIGGLRMASEMMRPNVVSFLDAMVRNSQGFRFEDLVVSDQSPYIGKPVAETPLAREESRVVALTLDGQNFRYNPPYTELICAGQRLVLLARSGDMPRLRKAMNGG